MHIPCNVGSRGYWCSRDYKRQGMFVPDYRANPRINGVKLNPVDFSTKTTWSCRIFVGFNIGMRQGVTMPRLISLVKKIRIDQTGLPNSTFLTQKGIYTYTEGKYKGKYTEEKGAQVIILNAPPIQVSRNDFEKQMQDLGEAIARAFTQEQVVVEIQKNGVVQITHFVIPYAKKKKR